MIISDTTVSFNEGWEVQASSATNAFIPVQLPRDAMIREGRSADADSGGFQAYFRGGSYVYRKKWCAPPEWAGKRIFLYFEGVYRQCQVIVNGQEAGRNSWGLADFEVRIDGQLFAEHQENTIELHVQNVNLPSARWYIGSGVLKPVWVVAREAVSLKPGGVFFKTLSVGSTALTSVTAELTNSNGEDVALSFTLLLNEQEVAHHSCQTRDTEVSATLSVPNPLLWSHDAPNLYKLVVKVENATHACMVGLRTLEWSAQKGFLVNSQPTLLRGACIHHDSGVLGGVTLPDYELWRVKILRDCGFNAIRSAHNPAPQALLHACDVHGMYLMDEYHDYWYYRKADCDDAPTFADRWETEVDAMVRKARNHASVVMYSIGNEVMEPMTRYGMETARRLVERVRVSDDTRPVTCALNLMLAAVGWPSTRTGSITEQPDSGEARKMDSTTINALFALVNVVIKNLPRLPRANRVTRDLFDMLDIAGYNYGEVRYATDTRLHPNRILLGTETLPDDIARNWVHVKRYPALIGDFMWTGWEYLGESGMADWLYGTNRGGFHKPYPQLSAGCGAVDLIGTPGFTAYLAQAAWGLLPAPVATVRPPHLVGKKTFTSPWRKSDAEHSWSWRGCEGKPAEIQVISSDEVVEVLVNGRSLGRRHVGVIESRYSLPGILGSLAGCALACWPMSGRLRLLTLACVAGGNWWMFRPPGGRRYGNIAHFKTRYQPGELTVVGYRGGEERSRSTLRSAAGEIKLRLAVSNKSSLRANGTDLAIVRVLLCDAAGTVEMLEDDEVTVVVDGPARLEGFGSGARATAERYDDNVHTTWRGQALIVVRAGMVPGCITVTARSKAHGIASLVLEQA